MFDLRMESKGPQVRQTWMGGLERHRSLETTHGLMKQHVGMTEACGVCVRWGRGQRGDCADRFHTVE